MSTLSFDTLRGSGLAVRPRLGERRFLLAALAAGGLSLIAALPAEAGGYVDGSVVLNPASAIASGGISVTPTFNNEQFNDRVLVGTVNNDPVRTPSTADPVSTVSGNNYHDETDFVIRGRNGLNLVFTRTYNSAPAATTRLGALGYGWTHSYAMRLRANDFGVCPNCSNAQKPENANGKTSSITYTDERGGEQNYLVNETSFAVTNPKGVYDALTLDSPAVGQHTLTFRNGVKYIFETPAGNLKTTPDVAARLKYIDSAWGDRLTLSYDGSGRLSSLTDNLGIAGRTGLAFTYHPDGRLKEVSDWSGRVWRYGYTAGDLTSKTNPLSQAITYTYHPGHLLNEITLPLQREGRAVRTAFKYYQNGRTFSYANSLGQVETLDYDLFRKSTRVSDPRGGVREYYYDDNGAMVKLIEPDGAVLLFENQAESLRSKKYDALGYATTYSYRTDKAFTGAANAFGQVTREQDALGRTVDFSYGPLDQIASVKDKRGVVTTTSFAAVTAGCDYAKRPKEMRISALSGVANVLLASFCWNPDGTLKSSRQYLDATRYRETRLTYEPGSNGLSVSQEQLVGMPSGTTITRTYTYDALGRKRSETLKRRASPTDATLIELTTSYEYDALDRVTKVTDALGNEAINSFDDNGQQWKVTHRYKNPDGSFEVREVVTRSFDAAERIKTVIDAEGNLSTFGYDEAGNLIAVTDAEGHTARVEYDAMNRRTAVVDATGYRTLTSYLLRGDVVGITNANGESVNFEVDALGRQTAMIDPNGYRTEYQYDENGNLTCVIDANAQAGLQPKNTLGCSEYRQYDELSRPIRVVDALNGETRFSYDFLGNRLAVTDAENKTWRFGYDDLGRLTAQTDHSGKVVGYQPDEAGNVYEKVNRVGEMTRYTFDAGNRLTRVDYLLDGSAETFGYDAAGNLNAATNPAVGYALAYDRLNRLTAKLDSRGRSLAFTYDKAGNLLTKTTYQGSTTRYLYNAANRLVQLSNPDYLQVDYQYDPAGRLLSRVMSSGARSVYQYQPDGALSRLTHYDGANALIADSAYTRDRLGHITQATDAGGSTLYAYDALYRLNTADFAGTASDEAFGYDKAGNRTLYTKGSLVANANTRYYNYLTGTNRLAEIRIGAATGTLESSFAYDAEGRLTSQSGVGARTLSWDAKGRVAALVSAGRTESYLYDPLDQRIGRSGGSLGTLGYFLEGEHLESIYSGANLQAKYLRGGSIDELVAGYLYDADGKLKPYLFHHDHLTSTAAVSGHNGGTLQTIRYGAFGSIQANSGSSPNRLKYTGREDDGTGLYYYRARYYDPSIGRFISEDPLGFEAGDVNFYAYVGNDPVNGNDPSGLAGKASLITDALREIIKAFRPGPFAKEGVELVGPGRQPASVQKAVNAAGDAVGCHLCGAPVPGTTSGNWIVDHIPPSALAKPGEKQLGFPSCADCYPVQGAYVKAAKAAAAGGAAAAAGDASAAEGGSWLSRTANRFLEGLTTVLDVVDALDPFQYFTSGSTTPQGAIPGPWWCFGCYQVPQPLPTPVLGPQSSYNGAAGGFVIYPNKSNANMSQSVYSK